MAAALTEHLSNGRISVRSAGSRPGVQIHSLVIEAMREIGVDVTREFPKPLTDEVVRAADVVITKGCGDACPIYPGKHYEDWPVPDPIGADLDGIRAIREDIRARVGHLIATLSGDAVGSAVAANRGPVAVGAAVEESAQSEVGASRDASRFRRWGWRR